MPGTMVTATQLSGQPPQARACGSPQVAAGGARPGTLRGVLHVLRRALAIAAAQWPALLTWFLLGWGLRFVAIRAAATVGAYEPVLGLLVLPLAVLARLASYVAMFLAVRDSLPAYSRVRAEGGLYADGRSPGEERGIIDVASTVILPFFTFYAAWHLLRDDVVAYTFLTLGRIDWLAPGDHPGPFELGGGPAFLAAIGVAYCGRLALKHFRGSLPTWCGAVGAYLEAVWVFLAVSSIADLIPSIPQWLETRRVIVAARDWRDQVLEQVEPLRVLWHALEGPIAWLTSDFVYLLMVPAGWLTIAGVVYGRALADPPQVQHRIYVAAEQRWRRLPGVVRHRAAEVGEDFRSRWRPIANSVRLIMRAGAVPMAVFVLAYTVVDIAGDWLFMAISAALGPHPLPWWLAVEEPIGFAVDLMLEPLLICLVAAAYDFCIERVGHRALRLESDVLR